MERKVAGVDFGASLIKIAWRSGVNTFGTASTLHSLNAELVQKLLDAEVTHLARVGGNPHKYWFPAFDHLPLPEDRIAHELECQVLGVAKLLEEFDGHPKNFLLVSVGTGVSYTRVLEEHIEPQAIGGVMGGGYINEHARLYRIPFGKIDEYAARGHVLDRLLKDVYPELADTPRGDLIHSFGFDPGTINSSQDYMATTLNRVAATLVQYIGMKPEILAGIDEVVYIGTCISHLFVLRRFIETFHQFLSTPARFLEGGEYSAAIGALLMHELGA